ncbi:putative ATP-binding component of a transport system (plasmid) [Ensifer adhaerens OV14]|nr:putative ATP-binding component of a transport system [Ensifer adhaerens OV14]
MPSIIETSDLMKRFGDVHALDGVDLIVEAGEVHGFLGPNGAGKSTTIRILLGLLRRDGGHIRVLGGDPWKDAVKLHKRLAYVPGDVTLWPELSGGEIIDLLLRLRGPVDLVRKKALIERFEFDPRKKAKTYSKGNRQKVALIAAFAANTELLILDEPTSGLDPLMENVFRDCVLEEKGRGRTVLLSSHILSEVEALCGRISIIRSGRMVESGTLAELGHLTSTIVVADLKTPNADLAHLAGVKDVKRDGQRFSFQVDANHIGETIAYLSALGITGLTVRPPTLEALFLRHYQSDGRGAA